MGNPGHTPGPWTAEYDGEDAAFQCRVWQDRPDGFQVAAIIEGGDEGEANARLIAAAPELLQRAKEARDVLRRDGAVFLADHLEQAIEKAEGR